MTTYTESHKKSYKAHKRKWNRKRALIEKQNRKIVKMLKNKAGDIVLNETLAELARISKGE